jgi:hypothetical protein
MVTSINLGGISEQNGRTVVSGTSSGGIDTEALLEGLTAARRLPAVQLEERITSNETVSTKYGELQEILRTFQDASDFLRNPPGVGNQDENIFEYRTSTLSLGLMFQAMMLRSISWRLTTPKLPIRLRSLMPIRTP